MKVTRVFVTTVSVTLMMSAAFASEESCEPTRSRLPDVIGRSMQDDGTFQLRAERFGMHDLPNFELKDWPQKPEINEAIVNQIDAVKTDVPEWHGLHHMVPGAAPIKN